jgi:hypothetical protein
MPNDLLNDEDVFSLARQIVDFVSRHPRTNAAVTACAIACELLKLRRGIGVAITGSSDEGLK